MGEEVSDYIDRLVPAMQVGLWCGLEYRGPRGVTQNRRPRLAGPGWLQRFPDSAQRRYGPSNDDEMRCDDLICGQGSDPQFRPPGRRYCSNSCGLACRVYKTWLLRTISKSKWNRLSGTGKREYLRTPGAITVMFGGMFPLMPLART